MGALFHDGVPTFSEYDLAYGRLVVTEAEGDRMVTVLCDRRAQLLAGHGANVTGSTLQAAVIGAIYLVMNARHRLQTELLGSPQYYTDPEESIEAIVDDVILSPLVIERVWVYYTRRLDDRR
jgi:ribulose-5-phosphate 4-epimerase/fuculose-1-phosphate aldolase